MEEKEDMKAAITKLTEITNQLVENDKIRALHDAECLAERENYNRRIGDLQKSQALSLSRQDKTDEMMNTLSSTVTKVAADVSKFMEYFENFMIMVQAGGITKKLLLWMSGILGALMVVLGFVAGAITLAIKMAAL